jgi:hypothetical protein
VRRPTVAMLREFLKDQPDDALIVAPGFDHSYRGVGASAATALLFSDGQMSEDFGEDNSDDIGTEGRDWKRVKVVVIE